METIVLSGKRELDIYVNPMRQNILRHMRIAGEPHTPKQLADTMGITPSSAQHHIKKLLELGVLALDRTESIRGITASFYKVLPVTVSIGLQKEGQHTAERFVLMQNTLSSVFSGFSRYCEQNPPVTEQEEEQWGDMLSGIVHLKQQEASELYHIIRDYLKKHEVKKKSSIAWEYALLFYPTGKEAAEE